MNFKNWSTAFLARKILGLYATKVSKQIKNEGSVASGSRREEAAGFSQQEASQAMGSLGGWNTKMRKETKIIRITVHAEIIWNGISFGTFEKNQWRRLFEKGNCLRSWVFDWLSDNHFHNLMSLKPGVLTMDSTVSVIHCRSLRRSWCSCCSLTRWSLSTPSDWTTAPLTQQAL